MSGEGSLKNTPVFKLLLVGDSCVGKTSLLIRFKDHIFLKGSYISTVGIDYKTKLVNAKGKPVRLQIWDTAGQEKFRSITKSYYRDSDAVILVYDITRMDTLVHTKSWMSEISANTEKRTLTVLTGNKADMERERIISIEDGECIAKDSGALFWETSAKTGQNVDEMFQSIAEILSSNSRQNSESNRNGIQLGLQKSMDTSGKSGSSSTKEEDSLSSRISECCKWS
ncbi:unnamed protein product [Calicophoron daubneyi]|uniref:Uncharacterized protein n=1 Tax=Calicophoron daubneyi TaxID=300641 RepID=A0AAV2TB71_CALDB